MSDDYKQAAISALAISPRQPQVSAPASLVPHFAGRLKRSLGEHFGLTHFGVNLVQLSPGAISSLRHAHSSQDEFVYVVQGEATLLTDDSAILLKPDMCAGFKAGLGNAHQLVNRTSSEVIFLEVGDRTTPDEVAYPDDDLCVSVEASGKVHFLRKDRTRYEEFE